MQPLSGDLSSSCFMTNDSCVRSKCFAIALLVSSVVLGSGMVVLGGIYMHSTVISYGGCMALFVSGCVVGVVGSVSGVVLLIKASRQENGMHTSPPDRIDAAVDIPGTMSLHEAARHGRGEIVSRLLEKNAPVDALDDNGYTPLHTAAMYGKKEIAELLLSKNANIDARDSIHMTPLHRVVVGTPNLQVEIIEFLLNKGATIDATDANGWTPLHLAAREGDVAVVKLLLARDASVSTAATAGPEAGWTPLHLAAAYGKKEVAELLLNKGAEINARDRNGRTPLHTTFYHGNDMATIRFLLERGASIHGEDGADWSLADPDMATDENIKQFLAQFY